MGKDHGLVSVITPTYQQAEFLRDCIDSVIAQTWRRWEQIIVDDGSIDATASIAATHADGRIRYVPEIHRGIWRLSETYNRALELAQGDFVAILEGDDVWLPDLLETLVPAFADPDVVLSYGIAGVLRGRGPGRYRIPSARFRRRFGPAVLFNDPIGSATYAMLHRAGLTFTFPCAVVIRRSALDSIGGFQGVRGLGTVDYPTFVQLSLLGRFSFTPRLLSYWRKHRGSTSDRLGDSMYEAVRNFALDFARTRAQRIGLDGVRLRSIERSWDELPVRLGLQKGRMALLNERWSEARTHFLRGLRTRNPSVFAAGVAGYVASFLHVNIEPLVRISGRIDLAREVLAGEEAANSADQ